MTQRNNTERDIHFANYFAQAVYLLKAAKYAMAMARDYCTGPKKKLMLDTKQKLMQATIIDITLKLREESWRAIQSDLNGEELQALSNIIHHLMQLDSVVDVEDEVIHIIKFIEKTKDIPHEEMDGKPSETPAEAGHHQKLPGEPSKAKEEPIWPVIAKGWQQKQGA